MADAALLRNFSAEDLTEALSTSPDFAVTTPLLLQGVGLASSRCIVTRCIAASGETARDAQKAREPNTQGEKVEFASRPRPKPEG